MNDDLWGEIKDMTIADVIRLRDECVAEESRLMGSAEGSMEPYLALARKKRQLSAVLFLLRELTI